MITENKNQNKKENKKSLVDTILTTVGLTTKTDRKAALMIVIAHAVVFGTGLYVCFWSQNPNYTYPKRICAYNQQIGINKKTHVISSVPCIHHCPQIMTWEPTPIKYDFQVKFSDGIIGLYHEKSLGHFDVYFQEKK